MQGKSYKSKKCKKGLKVVKAEEGLNLENLSQPLGIASGLGALAIEGATKSKYDSKITSQLEDENQALGRGIGAGVGQGLNLLVPGLGTVATPLLSSAGGAIQRGFQGNKLEKLKKQGEFEAATKKMNEGISTDLTSFQAKQYQGGTKKIQPYKAKTKEEFEIRNKAYTDSLSKYESHPKIITRKLDANDISNFKKYNSKNWPIGYNVGKWSNWEPKNGGTERKRVDEPVYAKPKQPILPPDEQPTFETKKDTVLDSSNGQYVQEVKSNDSRLANDKGYTKYKVKPKVLPKMSKGVKVIEIEGKQTPEIHTDKNFNIKNLGTTPHSKGGNKVLAEEGDVVFPTQNSTKKYNEIMKAIKNKDKYKLKKEQSKLPEDKVSKYPDGTKKVKSKEDYYSESLPDIGSGINSFFGRIGDLFKTNPNYTYGYGAAKNGILSSPKTSESNISPAIPNYSPTVTNPSSKPMLTSAAGYLTNGLGSSQKAESKGTKGNSNGSKKRNIPSVDTASLLPKVGTEVDLSGLKQPKDRNTYAKIDVPVAQKEETVVSGGLDSKKKLGLNTNSLMELAPIAYNLGQGLFGKTEKVNRREFKPELEKYVDTSANMRREVNGAYKAAQSNARNLSGGLASNMRANSQAAANQKLSQMNQIDSQEFGKQLDVNNRNTGLLNNAKLTNLQLNNQYDEIDAQNRAAKQGALAQGLTELGDLGYRNKSDKNRLKTWEDTAKLMSKNTNYDLLHDSNGQNTDIGFREGSGFESGLYSNYHKVKKGNPSPRIGVHSKGSKGIKVERKYKLKA